VKACNFTGARTIGAPADWDQDLDGSCGAIFVADAVDELSGLNFMYSLYQPTAADLEALNRGGFLRLGIAGRGHPVFNMVVMKPETAEPAGPVPMWDLGGPV